MSKGRPQLRPTGRFAPSPTGPLHLGSLRTALAAWLFARSSGGAFRLRIEDLDPDRSRPAWEAGQIGALSRLGIDWDGAVIRQSTRGEAYAAALAGLQRQGRVYPCFCTRAEIRAAASAPHADGDARAGAGAGAHADGDSDADADSDAGLPEGAYPGTCRELGARERERRVAAGERHALRFAADGERVEVHDLLAGRRAGVVDDFVLRRSDGVIAYQLAVVVDDFHQGVSQVVRGADLLDSTGRQTLLMRCLGYPEPSWAHLPLVLGPDGRRLAKRHGHHALGADRVGADGVGSPGAVLGVLARSLGVEGAGWARAADLLGRFDPARIPPDPVSLAGVDA